MAVTRFEDLVAWQKSRTFAGEIYKITQHGDFSRDYGLKDQIRRASVSIMSNIAEGYERASPAEFQRFLLIAKASCAEVRSQLYLAHDIGYLSVDEFRPLLSASQELGRIIGGLHRSINR